MSIEINAHQTKNWGGIIDRSMYGFLVLTGFFIPLSITATDIFMTATALLGILSGRFLREFDSIRRNAIVWCAVWIVILVFLAMMWSIAPWDQRFSALHKYAKLLYIPLLWVVCTDTKWRDRTIAAFLLGVFITVILSYLKAWTGLHFGRNPNPAFVFYTHIETGFLVAFAIYLLALFSWKQPRWRWLCIPLILMFSYQELFINDSRTGLVAFLILFLVFAAQFARWKGLLLGLALVSALLGGSYYASPIFRKTVQETAQEISHYRQGQPNSSIGYRISFNSLGWRLAADRPIIGYGAGSFAEASKLLGGVPGWRIIQTPHNEYMMMMVEFGGVGLLSLIILFGMQWLATFRLDEMRHFAQGLIVVFMASAFYNAFLYLSVSGHFYVLFTALFFAQYRHDFSWKPGISGISKKYKEVRNSPA